VIVFRDAVVRYPGAEVDTVHGVTLVAATAQLTAVVGPNGSGKSTLVRALIGRVPLASGAILLDDAPVTQLSGDERARRIAVVSQREDLAFPTLVSEYVALGRFPHLGVWRAAGPEDQRAIEGATTAAGVSRLDDRRIDTLSGGEWQRVRLARALAQSAEALVLDEPTAFLDVAHEMAVFELLHRVARSGQAVLLVSHQLNLVARFADHLVLLHRGRVAAAGSPDEVMRAEILEPVYEWPLVVTRDPAVGAPALVPLRGRTGAGRSNGAA